MIQPKSLQGNLSLFLQLLKAIPELNNHLCRHILIFHGAEKLSWPYFSNCKTNFLQLKSGFAAGSLQHFAFVQHGEASKSPSYHEGNRSYAGRKVRSSGIEIRRCVFRRFSRTFSPVCSYSSRRPEACEALIVAGRSGLVVRQPVFALAPAHPPSGRGARRPLGAVGRQRARGSRPEGRPLLPETCALPAKHRTRVGSSALSESKGWKFICGVVPPPASVFPAVTNLFL